jgi:hypothetical protein
MKHRVLLQLVALCCVTWAVLWLSRRSGVRQHAALRWVGREQDGAVPGTLKFGKRNALKSV